jgi:hypothetical protein
MSGRGKKGGGEEGRGEGRWGGGGGRNIAGDGTRGVKRAGRIICAASR